MPITKVPIKHRFGIISHSQRIELQERLMQQAYQQSEDSNHALKSSKNPFEVTEDFVQNFNNAEGFKEQEKFNNLAYKMLERIKRRAGLKDGGVGSHVDLPIAWTELAQLAQCKGKLQEDCLDILITSLEQVPVESLHIAALFYLAETTLYWLRTEAINQPYLRTTEIKLLHMGQLIFCRLFFHHMSGHLQGKEEFKNRLSTYLDGFSDSQDVYSPYPNALLYMRYISEVGKMVVSDLDQDLSEIKDSDNQPSTPAFTTDTASAQTMRSHEPDGISHIFSSRQSVVDLIAGEKADGRKSVESGAISGSVHDLSPTLWHALDTWRCLHTKSPGLPSALTSLAKCGMGLASENWVDVLCAVTILGDASKKNLSVLKMLQCLAMGVKPLLNHPDSDISKSFRDMEFSMMEYPHHVPQATQPNTPNKAVGPLSDIYEKSEEYFSSSSEKRTRKSRDTGKSRAEESDAEGGRTAGNDQHSLDSRQDTQSAASSVRTYTNAVFPETPGLHGWHWEVAVTYVDTLADVCLHGNTSTIQKAALVGTNNDLLLLHRLTRPQCPMPSAGLLDLVYFKGLHEKADGGADDWSWRVRYSAIQGLVKVCRCTLGDSTKEGLRTVAWNTLLKAHSLERDTRVLEALKVGQVESNIENLVSKHMEVRAMTLGAKIAAGLAALYLPPLPQAVTAKKTTKPPIKKVLLHHPVATQKPLRTTLQEEIMLANALYQPPVAYETRTDFDLNRVVEDQWRKELQQQMEEEEQERQKEQQERQTAVEKAEQEREESRKAKLGMKYKGPAYALQPNSKDS